MSRKFKFTINKDRLLDATVDFHIHYGNAMARWAQLENALYLWFSAATAMNDAVGRAIFYSARGFAARAEMLEAAVEHATTLSPEQIEFLKEAIKKARQYSGFRNKVAHGEPRVHLYENEEGEKRAIFSIDQGRHVPSSAESLSMEDLDQGADNIHTLSMLIIEMWPPIRKPTSKSPQECLSLVRALPNVANDKKDHSASAPDPSPQRPVRRNKKEYRAAKKTRKRDLPPDSP